MLYDHMWTAYDEDGRKIDEDPDYGKIRYVPDPRDFLVVTYGKNKKKMHPILEGDIATVPKSQSASQS